MKIILITKHDTHILENISSIEYNDKLDTYLIRNDKGNTICTIRSYLVERIEING